MSSIFRKYTDGSYIYPPRAETQVPANHLQEYEDSGEWLGQPKLDGSCSTLIIAGKGNSWELYNRHNERLTLQKPIHYEGLNPFPGYMVLCGEYLNKNKPGEGGADLNHSFVIWDILVLNGVYLLGETLDYRISVLASLYGESHSNITPSTFSVFDYLHVTPIERVYRAVNVYGDFYSIYRDLVKTELYEGLVLKRRDARLMQGFRAMNNAGWQLKCRKPRKNTYNF